MRILAVDLGGRRTGLAISDADEKLAVALPTLMDTDAATVVKAAKEHEAGLVVVGLPLNMDGTPGPAAQRAQAFAQELQGLVAIPVATWDERLSSAEGEARLKQAGLRRKDRAKRADAAAAIVILETFLAARRKQKK